MVDEEIVVVEAGFHVGGEHGGYRTPLLQLLQLVLEPHEVLTHIESTFDILLFAVFFDLNYFAVQSFYVVFVDDLQRKSINIWLLITRPSEVIQHVLVFRHISVYQSFRDCFGVIHQLSPVVELVREVVFD